MEISTKYLRTTKNLRKSLMEWKLDEKKDLPQEGHGKSILLPNGREIAIFCSNGRFYAIDNTCTHEGGPLGEGELDDCIVTCPWHGWQFNVKTGACQNMIGDDVVSFPIIQKNDGFYLVIPDAQ